MIINIKILCQALIFSNFLLIGTVFAAIPASSTDNNMKPTTQVNRVHCATFTVGSTQVKPTSQPIDLSNPLKGMPYVDATTPGGSQIIWVLMNSGGTLNPVCNDPAYPYLCSYNERWVLITGSGRTESWGRCCAPPTPSMSMQYDDTTWQSGTSCN